MVKGPNGRIGLDKRMNGSGMVQEEREYMATDAIMCVDVMVRVCGSSLLGTFGNKITN